MISGCINALSQCNLRPFKKKSALVTLVVQMNFQSGFYAGTGVYPVPVTLWLE